MSLALTCVIHMRDLIGFPLVLTSGGYFLIMEAVSECHPDVAEKDLDWGLVGLRPWAASKTYQDLTFNLGAERCRKPREEVKLALANLNIEFLGL